MKKEFIYLLLLSTASMIQISCDNEVPMPDAIDIADVAVTGAVSEVGGTYALVDGVINLDIIPESDADVEAGLELSASPDFREKTRHVAEGLTDCTFSLRVGPLSSQTEYWYRTYVSVSRFSEVYYGETRSFVTARVSEAERSVDMGLPSGTLWGAMNVGAESPEEYGSYFAWGETAPKDVYNWATYKWCKGTYNTQTKYCNDSIYGYGYIYNDSVAGPTYKRFVDELTELEPSDDAAYVNWGENWRMPSSEQFSELLNDSNTSVVWTTLNGVHGRKVTSKRNGNSIFLPAAGGIYEASFHNTDKGGYFWSRTLGTESPYGARGLYFDSFYFYTDYYDRRYYGRSVRPVHVLQ